MIAALLTPSIVILAAASLSAADEAPRIDLDMVEKVENYTVEVVANGLRTPWNIDWLPSGDMLVTERPGTLRIVRDGELLEAPVEGVPEVFPRNQAGLFEVVPHPDFEENSLVYLTYAVGTPEANTLRLARARFVETEESGRLEDLEVLFTADANRSSTHHYGGRMVWATDGTLFVTSGEGSSRDVRVLAQSVEDHFGTVLRFNADGSVPNDNPFLGQDGAKPEIWSYGHRNPQGIDFAADGTLYTNEHGPRGGDEVNVTEPGKNYGWPAITYGIEYSGAEITPLTALDGMEQPLFHWTPSIAPSALVVYDGTGFPAWQGMVMTSALVTNDVRIADPSAPGAAQISILSERGMRIRDVTVGPDGHLYAATEVRRNGAEGEILRILPKQ